jgi:hypothetical protein
MKKIFSCLCIMFLLLVLSIQVFAAAKQVTWSAPTTGGTPANYTLYYTDGTNNYNKTVPAAQTGILLTDLNLAFGKTYTFTVKASNAAGEGPASNSVTYAVISFTPLVDKLPPTIIQITGPVTITIGE